MFQIYQTEAAKESSTAWLKAFEPWLVVEANFLESLPERSQGKRTTRRRSAVTIKEVQKQAYIALCLLLDFDNRADTISNSKGPDIPDERFYYLFS